MGALFSSPPKPPPIPVPPPAAAPATFASAATQATSVSQASTPGSSGNVASGGTPNNRRGAAGIAGTIGTSPQGLQEPPKTANATLLGGGS